MIMNRFAQDEEKDSCRTYYIQMKNKKMNKLLNRQAVETAKKNNNNNDRRRPDRKVFVCDLCYFHLFPLNIPSLLVCVFVPFVVILSSRARLFIPFLFRAPGSQSLCECIILYGDGMMSFL